MLVRLALQPADSLGLRIGQDGVSISAHPTGVAKLAGVCLGDVIVTVNDVSIKRRPAAELLRERARARPTTIEVRRGTAAPIDSPKALKKRRAAVDAPSSSSKKRKSSASSTKPAAKAAAKPKKISSGQVTDLNALLRKLPSSEALVLRMLESCPDLAMQESKHEDDLLRTNVSSGGSSVGRIWPLHIASQWSASAPVMRALLAAYPEGAAEFAWDPEGQEQCWQGGGRDGSRAALPLHLALQAPAMEPKVVRLLFEAYPEAARWRDWLRSLPLHLAVQWALAPGGSSKPSKDKLDVIKLIGEAFPQAVHHTDMDGAKPIDYARDCKQVKALIESLSKAKASAWQVGDMCDDEDRFGNDYGSDGGMGYGSGGGSECGSY